MDKSEEDTIDKKLDYLTRVLCETAEQIVPKRLIRLDGFKWKASPKVGEQVSTNIDCGIKLADPETDITYFLTNKRQKRLLENSNEKKEQ